MTERQPIEHSRYVAIALTWYLSVAGSGGLAAWLLVRHYDGTGFELALAIIGAILIVLAVVAPAAVALTLWRFEDPAMAMTVSAVIMLGHILLIAGPFVLATPFVARHLALARYRSGGF